MKKLSNDIVICDINKSMLEVGRRRAHVLGIDQGKIVQCLPLVGV